jgi:hypothetical protein
VSVAALIASLAPVLLFASPVAAANNIVIQALYGDCGFFGSNAGAGKTISIEWRDAEGEVKSKHKVRSDTVGDFFTDCELGEFVESGDVLTTQIGTNIANVRMFTVPKMTAAADRVGDAVTGKVQTDGLDMLLVEVDTYDGGFGSPTAHQALPTFTPNTGVQSYTTAGTWDDAPDIKGWDDVFAVWIGTRGDTFVRTGIAEGMRIWLRQPIVEIAANPGDAIHADLESSLAVARGSLDAAITTFGSPDLATWHDPDGDTVRARPGDHVLADFASDAADVVLPTISATINKSTDKVTVDCNISESGQTGVLVVARKRDFSDFGERLGFQSNAAGGTFIANFANNGAVNLARGDKVDVLCKSATGDIFAQTFTAP